MPYSLQIFLSIALFIIVAFGLWQIVRFAHVYYVASRHRGMMSQKEAILQATIDIDASGQHHVELISADDDHAVDAIQLAISYTANQLFVTLEDPPDIQQPLVELAKLCVQYDESQDQTDFLQRLSALIRLPPSTRWPSTSYTVGDSERYVAKLVRGNNIDYALADFPVRIHQPNLMNSAVYLFASVAKISDRDHLHLLVKALLVALQYFHEKGVGAGDNQYVAYIAVEQGMTVLGGSFDRGPARPRWDNLR